LELCGDDLTTPLACAFLQKWSSLQQLKKARPETIRRFYYAQNARRGDVIEKRLALIAQAVALTNDPALIESSIITVQALTLGLRAAHTAIARFDREIARTFTQHPDASLFAALPGSGTVYSARLLAAFGSRRERFESAEALLNFSGIAPVLKRSGQTTIVHRRYARPIFLHQSFIEYANESIRHSLWARAFYQMHKAANKATGSSSALWLTNGSASSFAAGRSAPLTTNFATSNHFKKAAPPYSNTLPNPTPKLFE